MVMRNTHQLISEEPRGEKTLETKIFIDAIFVPKWKFICLLFLTYPSLRKVVKRNQSFDCHRHNRDRFFKFFAKTFGEKSGVFNSKYA
jgi:hypothetical protein